MRKTIRTVVGVSTTLVILLAAAPALATSSGTEGDRQPGAATDGWRAAALDWEPCAEHPDEAGLSCATLDLPIDWARPAGATFPLALARRAATGPGARVGPLLLNPGGPGGSGVEAVFEIGEHLGPELRQRFDVISFDPRGVARSNAVRCSHALLAQQPSPVPADQAAYEQLIDFNHRLYDDCRAHTGPLFDHVDTLSVVRDLDAIRAALGERQISFYGESYGTLIGQEYAERFPDRLRALVIDSNMDHSLGTKAFLRTEAAGAEVAFGEFVAWCDRDGSCALHGRDVGAYYDGLMRRADAGTLVDPASGAGLGWFDLSGETLNKLYGPDWPGLAGWLASLDGAGTVARAPDPAAGSTGELDEYPLATFCQDWSLPVDGFAQFTRYLEVTRSAAPHLRASSAGTGVTSACLDWKGAVNNPQHPLRVRTSLPVLVINSRYDPATPYDWATNVADQLGRSGRLVTYLGWGHMAYLRTPCTIGHVDRYLIDRVLPPAGATCAAPAPAAQPSAVRRGSAPAPRVGAGW